MRDTTGWELHNRTHFDEIVAEYERIRPEWPDAIFDDILRYSGSGRGKKAVEIGAGTGKATYPFLLRGYDVTAVEISGHMSDFLRKRFDGDKNFRVIVSAFEDASLEEGVYDLAYAASAFHWVDAELGCPKAFRLLKDEGVIALFRYNEIASVGDALYDEIQTIFARHHNARHSTPYLPPVRKTHDDFTRPREIYKGFRLNDLQAYGFRDATMRFYDAPITYGADEYIAFLCTLADHRSLPESDRAAFHAEVKDTIQRHGGSLKLDYVFQLYMGRK